MSKKNEKKTKQKKKKKKKRKGRKEKPTKYEQEMQLSIGLTFTTNHVGDLFEEFNYITDIFLSPQPF